MKEQNVIDFYVQCNKLKDIVRTGWKVWNVKRERCESIAEHIYGVQMLAIAMWSEYKYEIDMKKVLTMIAVHELEEVLIGDFSIFQISREEKEKLGHEAIKTILKNLEQKETIESLILEFDKRETSEAKFAYQCDKLECDIQCKIYDEENCVSFDKFTQNEMLQNEDIKKILKDNISWSELWIKYGQSKYNYDENFMAVSNYALRNIITKKEEN